MVIGSESQGRMAPDAFVAMSLVLAITGTVGIVLVIRMLLKMATVAAAAAPAPAPAPPRLAEPPRAAALPPPVPRASVVEHTTAHLPDYARPRDTGE
jgi:hypothetical protein